MIFHKNLRDSKNPRGSRTLLSILSNLDNSVIWIVSIIPLICSSASLFLVTLKIGSTITFMFYTFNNDNNNLSILHRAIGLVSWAFANGPGDWGLIPGRVIPKTQKMVFDAALLNTQHYKVRIKGKVEQSRERSRALPFTSV